LIKRIFLCILFFNFWSSQRFKTLDLYPDAELEPDPDLLQMLDQGPHQDPDSINPDPKHWWKKRSLWTNMPG